MLVELVLCHLRTVALTFGLVLVQRGRRRGVRRVVMSAEQQQSKDTPTPERGKKRSRLGSKVDGDKLIREKIAQLEEPFHSIAARLHELIRSTAPELTPRLWYGLPAYTKEGAVICFFRGPETFGERYLTFVLVTKLSSMTAYSGPLPLH